jgi:hypothetical protein
MQMTKGSIKVQCDCGNKDGFLFTVKGGLNENYKTKPNSYWIVCADCDSGVELIGAFRP